VDFWRGANSVFLSVTALSNAHLKSVTDYHQTLHAAWKDSQFDVCVFLTQTKSIYPISEVCGCRFSVIFRLCFSVNCHEISQSKNSATQTFYSVVDKTRNRNWILERHKFQFLVPTSALLNDIVCISLLMLTRFCLLAQKCDWFHVCCF